MMRSVYKNQKPVTYDVPKPFKKLFTEDDLFKADVQTFGSLIGPLTNRGTSIVALISEYENRVKLYNDPEDKKKLELLHNRLKMVCAAQSRQIDKAKIGKEVKSYPKVWTTYQKVKEDDSEQDKYIKEFYNSLLCDKKPYFFKHLYKTEAKKYSQFKQSVDLKCYSLWDITLKQLLEKEDRTEEQEKFIQDFNTKNGFINSDCELNRICKYIESIHFNVKKNIREDNLFDYKFFITDDIEFNQEVYDEIYIKLNTLMSTNKTLIVNKQETQQNSENNFNKIDFKKMEFITSLQAFKDELFSTICSNKYEVVNYLIKIFYEDKKTLNKANLWRLCGQELYEIAYKKHNGIIDIPKRDDKGDIRFWNKNFSVITVDLKED